MDNEYFDNEELQPLAEPRFIFHSPLNASMQEEANKAVQSKAVTIFGYVCFALCVGMFATLLVLYFMTKNSGNLFYAAIMLLTIAYILYIKLVLPKKQRAKWEDQIQRAFGTKELHLVTEFYDRSLIQTLQEDEDNIVDAGYSELQDLKETEHMYMLRCRNRQWFFLSKDGLVKGNAEEFKDFIGTYIGGK